MADAPNPTQMWLRNLGAPNDPVAYAIISQGLSNVDILPMMEPSDINTIYTSAQRPGGVVVMVAGGPAVANPGYNVPMLLQSRLKLAVYAKCYYKKVGIPVNEGLLTVSRISQSFILKKINKTGLNLNLSQCFQRASVS